MSAALVSRIKAFLGSRDPKVRLAAQKANQAILNLKLLTPGAVHIDATMANLSIQYKNEEYIGTQLMPVATVPKLSDKYVIYRKRDRLAVPDDKVGARSTPNEINEHRDFSNYSCQPYALLDFVDNLTLMNQDAPLNEMVDLIAAVNDAIDLNEEIRIAAIMQATGSYASGNSQTNAGQAQWDSSSGGDPVGDIQGGMKALWVGRGQTKLVMWSGYGTYLVLSRHKAILDLFKYTKAGFATPDMIAQYFGADSYVVGKARKDSANEGQTANYGRVWSNNFGITRVASNPSIRIAAFGFTMRFGQKITTQWYDQKPGMAGGYYGKVGLAEDHRVVANETAYLIAAATSTASV